MKVPPGPLSHCPEPLNMELLAQMARDWNPAWSRLRMSAPAQRCWMKRRVASLLPLDGPVSGVSVKHRGVATAEEERLEIWKEGAGGGEVKLHAGFLALANGDGRSLVPGAA